jgi:hypothetical protein
MVKRLSLSWSDFFKGHFSMIEKKKHPWRNHDIKKTCLRNKLTIFELIIDLIQQNALYLSSNPPPPK